MKGASSRSSSPPKIAIHPLTADRWGDFAALFGPRGACGGCWCMWWRLPRSKFNEGKGAGNRRAMKRIVASGAVPGLIAYADGEPVGWCAVAPRESYPVLERSRILARIDDEPVWSVVCFFVAKRFRGRGLTAELLRAAVRHAAGRGARIVEGYPVEPRRGRTADAFVYTGLVSAFRRAGFSEAVRRSPTRPIMRISTGRPRGGRVSSSSA
jgi:GNAT superfamily N-acetyltransferase